MSISTDTTSVTSASNTASNPMKRVNSAASLLEVQLSGLDVVSKDVLEELYCYILRQQDIDISSADLTVQHVVSALQEEGLLFWRDQRFSDCWDVALGMVNESRAKYTGKVSKDAQQKVSCHPLDYEGFVQLVSPCARIFLKTFSEELVIPDWQTFCTDMTYHYYDAVPKEEGQTAQYIPILRDADPDKFGLSICSTDGQRFSVGDYESQFSLQSVSKPVTYALCLEEEGHDFVDEWIGVEPAGRPFNTQDLDTHNNPFNSSVNSGAIMACGVYTSKFPEETWREVVDEVRSKWYNLSGMDLPVGFSQETYDSEKETAYNNYAIAYNLKGRRGLPRDVNLHKMLDVYLGCCSIEITCEALSVAAATLANGGVCPITGVEVFPAHVTRTVLSEIMTCGMYDQAGRFVVEVGVPSKSGVSGALMVIVPNLFGFATFSPRLNEKGNSVRGIEFCKRLVSSYRVHLFEPLRSGNTGAKIDPRRNGWKEEQNQTSRMAWGVQVGDRYALRLRDIFLFALCQTAVAAPSELIEHMIELIRLKYEAVYQVPVDEKHLSEILDAVRAHPGELKFLKDLIKDVYILDSHRSIIILAMIEIIMVDGKVGEVEKSVAVRIAQLLGVDKEIALLELNRYECQTDGGHRGRRNEFQSMIEAIDVDVRRSVAGSNSAFVQTHAHHGQDKADNQRGIRQALDQSNEVGEHQENLLLRKEIFRLRRKVDLLTDMLQEKKVPK
jgi:glutaminase